ncbi:MAG: hypothetical protein CMJ23_08375 [Phycisphaerae bacterium]|nr:hypothetical protein [Phycisphaerae bacterium]
MKMSRLLGAMLLSAFSLATPVNAEPPSVVFVVGEGEYRSEWSMPALADLLEETHGMRTTVLQDRQRHGGPGNHIEGLEALETADLAVFYLRFRQLPQEQLDLIAEYIEGGGAVVGFRTSTHAFDYPEDDPRAGLWNDFGARVLGAPWKYHYGHDSTTEVTIDEAASTHPALDGIDSGFDVRSWTYHVRDDFPPRDANVLARGRPLRPGEDRLGDDTVNPVAWTWTRPDGGRTFTTTMGHPSDFNQPEFRRLLANGIHWALGRSSPAGEAGTFPRYRERTGEPWQDMDYGPFLSAAIEVDSDNIACKGVAIPLAEDGSIAAVFDTAELRWAAGWEGDFVELRGIVYDGPHGIWPRIDGEPAWTNPAGPGIDVKSRDGWSDFEDPRPVPFGPLPKSLGRFAGLMAGEEGVILRYSVGAATVLERLSVDDRDDLLVWSREIEATEVGTPFDLTLFGIDAEVLPVETSAGRPHLVIERDGEVVGAIGWVDEDRDVNARGSGKATLAGIHAPETERITARIKPPSTGSGDGRFRVVFASLDETLLPAFLKRLASAGPGGDLLAAWQAGSPRRWTETIGLRGELAVDFNPDSDEESMKTIEFGMEGGERRFRSPDGMTPRLRTLDGQLATSRTPSIDEAIMVFEEVATEAPLAIAAWNFDEDPSDAMLNEIDGSKDLRLDGVTWRRGVRGRSLDFDGTARAVWTGGEDVDPASTPLTISAWIHTTKDGTIVSRTDPDGDWSHDGVTFFIRDGRLAWDVGWVGVIEGDTPVADGRWHHVAVSLDPEAGEATLWVDGQADAVGAIMPEATTPENSMVVGFTNPDFPAESRFSGYLDGLRVHDRVLDRTEIRAVAAESGEPLILARSLEINGGGRLEIKGDTIEAIIDESTQPVTGVVRSWQGPRSRLSGFLAERGTPSSRPRQNPFLIDRVSWPDENPWDSWMRFGDFDFLDHGKAAAITTWNGDVWRVDGLDSELDELRWQRIATGLNQPLGLVTRGEEILVVGRDQITRLVDVDGDRETDRYEAFNVDAMNSPHFHEPASGLQVGPGGDLYYIKAARHAKLAAPPRHGTLIRVTPDGTSSSIVAGGFRAPNGLAIDSDGTAWSSDQEGHWMPANRINRIRPGSFQGNNWSGNRLAREPLNSYEPPLLWIHPTVDRSPAAQVRVPQATWGDFAGRLLGISYGTGEVYLILEDEVDGVHQGAFVPLPIKVPTGIMRGRFHPTDGSLYLTGLFGWSSDQTDPGGFYRVRRVGSEEPLPLAVRAVEGGLVLEFNQPVKSRIDFDEAFTLTGWNYRWSSDYGSPQLDLVTGEPGITDLPITAVTTSPDRRRLHLEIPGMTPAMQMHLDWRLPFEATGERESFIHFTVHRLGRNPQDD